MPLEAQLISIERAADRRGRQRRDLHLGVDTESETGTSGATIRNLSEFGFLLETAATLSPGDTVQVGLPRSGPRSARVVWVRDRLFGCEFDRSLTPGEMAAARLRADFDEVTAPADSAAVHHDGWSKRTKAWVITGLGIASWVAAAGIFALAA